MVARTIEGWIGDEYLGCGHPGDDRLVFLCLLDRVLADSEARCFALALTGHQYDLLVQPVRRSLSYANRI